MSARSPEIRERLTAWIEDGGVLVRFAGPRLAQADDDLVPVKLRRGGRTLGGSLTWEKPQHSPRSRRRPVRGMPVPKDVTVTRQVLAEPDAVLTDRTWATLADGTPLVTGEHRGKGVVVPVSCHRRHALVRSAAVRQLRRDAQAHRRHVRLHANPGAGVAGEGDHARRWRRCARSTASARSDRRPRPRPMPADFRDRATADHPPGFYGPPTVRSRSTRWRPPTASRRSILRAAARAPRQLHQCRTADLRGILLSSSLALFLIDAIVVALLGGGIAALLRRRAAPAALAFARAVHDRSRRPAVPRREQRRFRHQGGRADPAGLCRHRQCRRGFHRQGRHVRADLFLAQRTALEAGDPVGVDPARDELAFFPLIYWPVVPGAPKPPQDAINRIDAYMKQGGTVLFDTRDAIEAPPGDRRRIADARHAGVAQYPLLARRSRA
jgi:hypothetical protein